MKKKLKLLLMCLFVFMFGILASNNVYATSLSDLKSLGVKAIGSTVTVNYSNDMVNKNNLYCGQHTKQFHGSNDFKVVAYIELNGKKARTYDHSYTCINNTESNVNAELAFLLNLNKGYGSSSLNPSDAQEAIWNIANTFSGVNLNKGGLSFNWAGNSGSGSNKMNELATEYAKNVGNKQATEDGSGSSSSGSSSSTKLTLNDLTDRDKVTVSQVGNYFRVGPFRWEFDGTLKSITATGNVGTIPVAQMRYVKYVGKDATIVNASDIKTGETFYVDISTSSGQSTLRSLTLNVSSDSSNSSSMWTTSGKIVYTAKIWLLQCPDMQELMYVDTGSEEVSEVKGSSTGIYSVPLKFGIGLKKVDSRDNNIPLVGVKFKFTATLKKYEIVDKELQEKWIVTKEAEWGLKDTGGWGIIEEEEGYWYRWNKNIYGWKEYQVGLIKTSDGSYKWRKLSDGGPDEFETDVSGMISVNNIVYDNTVLRNVTDDGSYDGVVADQLTSNNIKATESYNPYYGYSAGSTYTIKMNGKTQFANQIIENKQKFVDLSGYVWLDSTTGKIDVTNEIHDSGEKGIDGIKVSLKEISGNTIKYMYTSEMNIYSEIEGGEYRFEGVDLDKLQNGYYYVEFEYKGMIYQTVGTVLNSNSGSKASDTDSRKILNNKFTAVNGNGSQSLNVGGVGINYNSISGHVSTVNNYTGDEVRANTNVAGYSLYSGFTPTSSEIRYVNLGLCEKPQVDYALSQDLYDVKIDVNGFSHIYRYGTVRYQESADGSLNGTEVNDTSSWNVGVKFQKNTGTYDRAIYQSDYDYEAPNHRDNEIKVYVTYKIALRNESGYNGKINSIVNYADNRYELIAAGTNIDDKDNITGNVGFSAKTSYNSEYSKYIIYSNLSVNARETNYIYVQFKIERQGVLAILNNSELLNSVAEINSYTTFNKDGSCVAVVDQDSVVGNAVLGNVDTYEDDTDSARSLRLELKNERALVGTVFVDSTGKDSNVYSGQERRGNGIFDSGEKTLEGIKVTLKEVGKDDSSYDGERVYMQTTTDANGNFEFRGYIPGNYTVTYTWGNNEYKVQYYKGTVYDESRNQSNGYWFRDDNVDIRKTDALDSSSLRQKIDDEMELLKYNTLQEEINKAYNGGSSYIKTTSMDSTTPVMTISVEYLTTITDGIGDQVVFTVRNVDFGIVERPKQKLEFSKRVSGYKIVLANGQVLVEAQITEDGKLVGTYEHTTYMPSVGVNIDGKIRTEMDSELIEGATLEVIYEMKVTNISELDYVSDRYYYYGNSTNSDYVRNSATQLVDYLDGRLAILEDENKWKEIDTNGNYLNDVNASQKNNTTYLNSTRTYLTTQLSKALAPNESNTVTLKASKLLTSTDDNTFNNQSEITEVTKTPGFNTGTPVEIAWNGDSFNFNEDNAETIVIIPSTGTNKAVLPLIIGTISLTIIGIGVFAIKKYVIDNK